MGFEELFVEGEEDEEEEVVVANGYEEWPEDILQ